MGLSLYFLAVSRLQEPDGENVTIAVEFSNLDV